MFNTALTGYQEVITDPSYAGQIITFTYPHIGNYGTTADDNESRSTFARGVIIRDLARRHSNWRADQSLEAFLSSRGLSGIAGLDTRRLTRRIRDNGAMPGAFGPIEGPVAVTIETLKQAAIRRARHRRRRSGRPGHNAVGLSLRLRRTHNRRFLTLASSRPLLTSWPSSGSVEVVPGLHDGGRGAGPQIPDGVSLVERSPADPNEGRLCGSRRCDRCSARFQSLESVLVIRSWGWRLEVGSSSCRSDITVPITPVMDETTGMVEITSQNHNFAVDGASVQDQALVDTRQPQRPGVCEGLQLRDGTAFSVQHHPRSPVRALMTARLSVFSGSRRSSTRVACLKLLPPKSARSAKGGSVVPTPNRHRNDHGHRVGPDRHRPGL